MLGEVVQDLHQISVFNLQKKLEESCWQYISLQNLARKNIIYTKGQKDKVESKNTQRQTLSVFGLCNRSCFFLKIFWYQICITLFTIQFISFAASENAINATISAPSSTNKKEPTRNENNNNTNSINNTMKDNKGTATSVKCETPESSTPSRLCKSTFNTTAPMYGVSLTSGKPVTVVQIFPDLLQQVIYETCE